MRRKSTMALMLAAALMFGSVNVGATESVTTPTSTETVTLTEEDNGETLDAAGESVVDDVETQETQETPDTEVTATPTPLTEETTTTNTKEKDISGDTVVKTINSVVSVQANKKAYVSDTDGNRITVSGTPLINGKKYWVKPDGYLGTGWLYLGNWKMYFDPNTYDAKVGMADINGKRYLFNSDGVMQNYAGTTIVNGKKYWFSTDDASLKTGWLTLAGMKLYFDPKTYVAATGWKTIDGKKYYFDENGVLKEGFITKGGYTYYLKSDGTYATGTPVINGEKYGFDSKGRQILGWYTLGSWKFYFDPDNGGAAVTTYIKLDDVTYYFNSDGTLASVSNNFYINLKDPANGKTYTLESQFESDPVVDDETLLAAVTYTESGNHELACQVATALVILNRVESKSYPDTLKYVVYQKSQFEVARSGALTKILKAYESNDQTQLKWLKTTEEAVAIALEIMGAYKTDGIERTIDDVTLPNGKTDFDYLGFMTPAAFERCNLDPVATEAFQIDDVMFFTKWITKS